MVLIGGGHAHLQIVRDFGRAPFPDAELWVVSDATHAVYSGMVPGLVAGEYEARDLSVDLSALGARCGARVVIAEAREIDATAQSVALANGDRLDYHVASVDIGSTVAGTAIPGVAEHALPTRPLGALLASLPSLVARARARSESGRPFGLAVVGGGAGGVELAFAFERALSSSGARTRVLLFEAGPRLLPGYARAPARRAEAIARERGIELRLGETVSRVEPGALELEGARSEPVDAVIWAAGAAAWHLIRDSGLATDEGGFLRVRPTLQAVDHPTLFGAGDAVTLEGSAWVPKAGVHAVREGAVLARNLRALLAGRPLEDYRPQRDFLTLLNLADGTAFATKWGLCARGRWIRRWKDRIDRRFVESFQ